MTDAAKKGHTFYECGCWETGCPFCDGGLALCTVCKGVEGTLTTDCCGRPLTENEEKEIYDEGRLDFKDGHWVEESA